MTSTIKVNTITTESGSTLTVGGCGKTVALASGASQTGFGRTGTVDWQTGSIKTTTFTAVNGQGFFADTSSGGFTMNLPAGTAGNIVSVADYTNTFQNNALTITPNGSQKIGGVNASVGLNTEGQSVTLVYVDDTEGWKNVQDSTSNVVGNPFLTASGGTETTSGNFKIHTFTGPGTFTVSNASSTAAENIVSYLVVAGGASGGAAYGGGAGAGGFREYKGPADCYTASPLNGNPGGTAVTVTAQAYPIQVGGGGAARPGTPPAQVGAPGTPSVFQQLPLQEVVAVVLELDHLLQHFLEVQVVEQVEMKLQIMAVVILHQYLHLKEMMVVNHQVLLGMVVVAVVEQEEQEEMVVVDLLDLK